MSRHLLDVLFVSCAGIVLVAINPYQSLPIYGTETITAYHSNESVDMDPHVYGVMEEAFRQMKRSREPHMYNFSGLCDDFHYPRTCTCTAEVLEFMIALLYMH